MNVYPGCKTFSVKVIPVFHKWHEPRLLSNDTSIEVTICCDIEIKISHSLFSTKFVACAAGYRPAYSLQFKATARE